MPRLTYAARKEHAGISYSIFSHGEEYVAVTDEESPVHFCFVDADPDAVAKTAIRGIDFFRTSGL